MPLDASGLVATSNHVLVRQSSINMNPVGGSLSGPFGTANSNSANTESLLTESLSEIKRLRALLDRNKIPHEENKSKTKKADFIGDVTMGGSEAKEDADIVIRLESAFHRVARKRKGVPSEGVF